MFYFSQRGIQERGEPRGDYLPREKYFIGGSNFYLTLVISRYYQCVTKEKPDSICENSLSQKKSLNAEKKKLKRNIGHKYKLNSKL